MTGKYRATKFEIGMALEAFVANDFCIMSASRATGISYYCVCNWVSKYYIIKQQGDLIVKQSNFDAPIEAEQTINN